MSAGRRTSHGCWLDSSGSSAADEKLYQRQIEATDQEIDALFYESYGLTEEETAIVEEPP